MLHRGGPDAELARVLRERGSARHEGLVRLSGQYPKHAPIWLELAEAALAARRREEAVAAGRQALELDRHLFSRFSPALREVCEHLVFKASARDSEPAPAAQRPAAKQQRRPGAYGRVGNAREIGQLAVEIAKARALKGAERRRRLEELTRKHPDQGRAWLALAEENLEGRRVEEAMAATQRALALDPELDRNLSPKLERALRYHKAGMDPLNPSKRDKAAAFRQRNKPLAKNRSAPRPTPGAASQRVQRPTPGAASQRVQRPTPGAASQRVQRSTPGAASQRIQRPTPIPPIGQPTPGRSKRPSDRHDGPSVGKHLARALELPDRTKRLEALRALTEMAPENPAVLFHYAIEAALVGDLDSAKRAGRVLQRIAPQRYEQLYSLAESYWPSTGKSPAPSRSQPEPKPQLEIVSHEIDPQDMFDWAPSHAKTVHLDDGPLLPPARRRPPTPDPSVARSPSRIPAMAPARAPSRHTAALPAARGVMPREAPPILVKPERMPSLATPPAAPVPTPERVEPVRNPAMPMGQAMPMHPMAPPPLAATPVRVWNEPPPPRPKSPWRTAGALAAGVFAGLLFAVILVLVLSRFDAVKASQTPTAAPETAVSMLDRAAPAATTPAPVPAVR